MTNWKNWFWCQFMKWHSWKAVAVSLTTQFQYGVTMKDKADAIPMGRFTDIGFQCIRCGALESRRITGHHELNIFTASAIKSPDPDVAELRKMAGLK